MDSFKERWEPQRSLLRREDFVRPSKSQVDGLLEASTGPRVPLFLWDQVSGLDLQQLREARLKLEAELGSDFVFAQGPGEGRSSDVTVVPFQGGDRELLAIAHRIRALSERGLQPSRLVFISVSGRPVGLPKEQTVSWIRHHLGKLLKSEPYFAGMRASSTVGQSFDASRLGKFFTGRLFQFDKNPAPLAGFSKLLLDWFTGEEKGSNQDSEGGVESLREELVRVLSAEWGVLDASWLEADRRRAEGRSRSFPLNDRFQDEAISSPRWLGVGPSENQGQRDEREGIPQSSWARVSAGTTIGGMRE